MAESAVVDPTAVVSEKKRRPRTKFEIPDGWIARGFTFDHSAATVSADLQEGVK